MNEHALNEFLKDIEYMKGKTPVFDIPSYTIKAGKIRVRTGK